MRSLVFLIVTLVVVLFASCGNETETPKKNNTNNNTPVELCDTLDATYDSNVAAILKANCTDCHSGISPAASIDLTNYNNAKFYAQKPQFAGAVNHQQGFVPMPYELPKLEQETLDVLNCWITNGFPEN